MGAERSTIVHSFVQKLTLAKTAKPYLKGSNMAKISASYIAPSSEEYKIHKSDCNFQVISVKTPDYSPCQKLKILTLAKEDAI